jgi:predicted flavoprotein YhiN
VYVTASGRDLQKMNLSEKMDQIARTISINGAGQKNTTHRRIRQKNRFEIVKIVGL